MPGGLAQLVGTAGAQNNFLTSNFDFLFLNLFTENIQDFHCIYIGRC